MTIPNTTLFLLLVLLPGFISLLIDRGFVYRPGDTVFDKLIRATFYTFIIHIVYTMIMREFTPWDFNTDKSKLTIEFTNRLGVILLFGIAVLLGCIVGWLKTNDIYMRLARRCKLTNLTARSSIWQDVFIDKRRSYVVINLKDGRRINGWPEYYSNQFVKGPVIFLSNAKWIFKEDEKEGEIEIPNPGILINSDEIQFIQFYKPKEE
ncbi:MAG: DUF6338 family protein [Candidatus Hatepunaea meridiana]|nr:DUF6338 family protein [Candidatus Hatepunaea meridiana]